MLPSRAQPLYPPTNAGGQANSHLGRTMTKTLSFRLLGRRSQFDPSRGRHRAVASGIELRRGLQMMGIGPGSTDGMDESFDFAATKDRLLLFLRAPRRHPKLAVTVFVIVALLS